MLVYQKFDSRPPLDRSGPVGVITLEHNNKIHRTCSCSNSFSVYTQHTLFFLTLIRTGPRSLLDRFRPFFQKER